MPARSPQADNWLRQVDALHRSYAVSLVPEPLLEGFLHYYINVARIYHVRVTSRTYAFDELDKVLHADAYNDMQSKRMEVIQEHPFLRDIFKAKHVVVINQMNSRPFDRDFDEEEILRHFDEVAKAPPDPTYGILYASAIRYNLGNGILKTLPVPVFHVHISTGPVSMRSLLEAPPSTNPNTRRRTRPRKARSRAAHPYRTRFATRPASPRKTRSKTRFMRR